MCGLHIGFLQLTEKGAWVQVFFWCIAEDTWYFMCNICVSPRKAHIYASFV